MAPLNSKQKIAGVLLASGASRRLKTPKQMVWWGNSYIINHVIDKILNSKISELYVVLGYKFDTINKVIDRRPTIIQNKNWIIGKSSSIIMGVKAVESFADGIIFFLVDQPFINKNIINKVIECSEISDQNILATKIKSIQTNPVLFKKIYFDKLKQLSGEQGGKIVINDAADIEWVEWGDEKLLMDIDTEEDLLKIREIYFSSSSSSK